MAFNHHCQVVHCGTALPVVKRGEGPAFLASNILTITAGPSIPDIQAELGKLTHEIYGAIAKEPEETLAIKRWPTMRELKHLKGKGLRGNPKPRH